jgi:hypothetical protein
MNQAVRPSPENLDLPDPPDDLGEPAAAGVAVIDVVSSLRHARHAATRASWGSGAAKSATPPQAIVNPSGADDTCRFDYD